MSYVTLWLSVCGVWGLYIKGSVAFKKYIIYFPSIILSELFICHISKNKSEYIFINCNLKIEIVSCEEGIYFPSLVTWVVNDLIVS